MVHAAVIFRTSPARRRIYWKPQLLWPLQLEQLKIRHFTSSKLSSRSWCRHLTCPSDVPESVVTRRKANTTDKMSYWPLRRGPSYKCTSNLHKRTIPVFSLNTDGVHTCVHPNNWYIIPTDYTADGILHGHRTDISKIRRWSRCRFLTLKYQTKYENLSHKRI
jgi:hypothetical protein